MAFDVFVSYSWSKESTRVFVHSLAAHLRTVGFNVGLDMNVDYGDSLTGFMNSICDSKHVLLIIDQPYVERADTVPDSGVAIENRCMADVMDSKPENWLSVAFVEEHSTLPKWLEDRNPKGFSFCLNGKRKYGSEQIEDLWRWLEGLPANKANATSPSVIRSRLARLERIDNLRDENMWASPSVSGTVIHQFRKAPGNKYNLGMGSYSFSIQFSTQSRQSVYLYNDNVHSIGLIPHDVSISWITAEEAEKYLVPGRTVSIRPNQQFVAQNKEGVLLVGRANAISCPDDPIQEMNSFVEFYYRIMLDD